MEAKIQGINARFPRDMTLEELSADEVLVVSHPGWRRAFIKDKNSRRLQKNFLNFERIFERDFLAYIRKREGYDNAFARIQLFFSYLFASESFNYIWEDLISVDALEYARERKIPVIATIPCTKVRDRYVTTNQFHFRDWINYWLDKNPSSFVLPTKKTFGLINRDMGTSPLDARDYHKTPEGREIFGEFLDRTDRRIWFAGGHLRDCLAQTFDYFSSQNRFGFLDDKIVDKVTRLGVCCELSPEQIQTLLSNISEMYFQETEPRARKAIIQMLRKDGAEEDRKREYTRLVRG